MSYPSCNGSNSTLWHLARIPQLRLGRRDGEVAQFAGLGILAERLQGAADKFRNVVNSVARWQMELPDPDIVFPLTLRSSLKPLPRIPHLHAKLQTLHQVDGKVGFQYTFKAGDDPLRTLSFLRSGPSVAPRLFC